MITETFAIASNLSFVAPSNTCGCGTVSGNLTLIQVMETYEGENDSSTSLTDYWCCRTCVQQTIEKKPGQVVRV